MNNEKYNQIIDEAYENYSKFILSTENQNNKYEIVKIPKSKEIFIKTVKSNDEIVKNMGKKYCEKFSEKWGLKIEERKLSLLERREIARNTVPLGKLAPPTNWSKVIADGNYHTTYDYFNIPTKLITITYKNEKTEVYE